MYKYYLSITAVLFILFKLFINSDCWGTFAITLKNVGGALLVKLI